LFFVICFLLFAFLFFFILTQVCSGRMAFILRSVAAGGFKQGLQHDCHEALTYILSTAHEEEIKFRNQRQRCSSAQIPEGAQIPACFGVVAKSFGIQERIELMVRAQCSLLLSHGCSPAIQRFSQCADCRDVRSKLELGFIISLPLGSSTSSRELSVETVFSASSEAEAVEATCTKCSCPTAHCTRSYAAVGAHVIIQLKRFRWDSTLNANAKVTPVFSEVML
jgi:hypothetical protein